MAGFEDYEEEVKECLEKAKTSNATVAASQISEARDMVQQVRSRETIFFPAGRSFVHSCSHLDAFGDILFLVSLKMKLEVRTMPPSERSAANANIANLEVLAAAAFSLLTQYPVTFSLHVSFIHPPIPRIHVHLSHQSEINAAESAALMGSGESSSYS
jgi:hypothetical protein